MTKMKDSKMDKMDMHEAPEGYIAERAHEYADCTGCAFLHDNQTGCSARACMPHEREDGCSVIFMRVQ